jgi:endoglucanase
MVLIGTPGGIAASAFGDFWRRMALVFLNQPKVMFGLMNEPSEQTAVQWHDVAVTAVAAIRSTGATNKIMLQGTQYTGAYSWVSSGNAAAWAGFTDSNFAFELHQYLDSDSSGTSADCTVGRGYSTLTVATDWARTNGYELFLGEMGWGANAGCTTEANAFVGYMTNNADVWLGWTYWAAGAGWGQANTHTDHTHTHNTHTLTHSHTPTGTRGDAALLLSLPCVASSSAAAPPTHFFFARCAVAAGVRV